MPQNESQTQSSARPATPRLPSANLAEAGKGASRTFSSYQTEFSKYLQEANQGVARPHAIGGILGVAVRRRDGGRALNP